MYKVILKDLILTGALIATLFACYFPKMPDATAMFVHSLLVVLFGVLAVFVWFENPEDEREQKHIAIGAQAAFIVGGLILVIGIVKQSLIMHDVDPWLFYAFGGMVLAKIIARMWAHRKC